MKSLLTLKRALLIAALGVSVPFATACGDDESTTAGTNATTIVGLTISPSSTKTINIGGSQDYSLSVSIEMDGTTTDFTSKELADLEENDDLTEVQVADIQEAVADLVWASSNSKVASIEADGDGSGATAEGEAAGQAKISVETSDEKYSDSVTLKVQDADGNVPDSGMMDAGAGGASDGDSGMGDSGMGDSGMGDSGMGGSGNSPDSGMGGQGMDPDSGMGGAVTAGDVVVTPVSGLTTTEEGGTATFTVVLSKAPTADVTLPVTTGSDEVELSAASLTFTSADFDTPQTVTLTGLDDDETDGDQTFSVAVGPATSDDAAYDGEEGASVTGLNQDDESAGVALSDQENLTTTEDGGEATFGVKLLAKPTADVTIALSSDDASEGSVSPASLTFTPANYGDVQTVTVTGINDDAVDGDQTFNIVTANAVSTDAQYTGLVIPDVAVTNTDDDSVVATAGITVVATDFTTTENRGTAAMQVSLATQPDDDVVVTVTFDGDARDQVYAADCVPPCLDASVFDGPLSLAITFTPSTWNVPETITLTGDWDQGDNGDSWYNPTITAAAAAGPYANLTWAFTPTGSRPKLLRNILGVVVLNESVATASYDTILAQLREQPIAASVKDNVVAAGLAGLEAALADASVLVVPSLTASIAGSEAVIEAFLGRGGTLVLTGDSSGHALALAALVRDGQPGWTAGTPTAADVADNLAEYYNNGVGAEEPWLDVDGERPFRVNQIALPVLVNSYPVTAQDDDLVFDDFIDYEGERSFGSFVVASTAATFGNIVYLAFDMNTLALADGCGVIGPFYLATQCIGWEYPLDIAVGGYHGGTTIDPPIIGGPEFRLIEVPDDGYAEGESMAILKFGDPPFTTVGFTVAVEGDSSTASDVVECTTSFDEVFTATSTPRDLFPEDFPILCTLAVGAPGAGVRTVRYGFDADVDVWDTANPSQVTAEVNFDDAQ